MEHLWNAPEIWPDQTVYIIGGGQSVLDLDLRPIHKRPVIGVNNAFEKGPWVDVTFFGDKRWWENNWKKLFRHPCLIVTNNNWQYFRKVDRVKQMKRNNRAGIWWRTQNELCWNKNSGGAAVNLAYLLGAAKIVLLGFDMKVGERKDLHSGHNWHDDHTRHHPKGPDDGIYKDRFIPAFRRIKVDLDQLNMNGNGRRQVEILNASPDSAMDYFPIVALEDTL